MVWRWYSPHGYFWRAFFQRNLEPKSNHWDGDACLRDRTFKYVIKDVRDHERNALFNRGYFDRGFWEYDAEAFPRFFATAAEYWGPDRIWVCLYLPQSGT
ncbi:hypothetical protein BPJM79_20704 [Bacillus pumilus]